MGADNIAAKFVVSDVETKIMNWRLLILFLFAESFISNNQTCGYFLGQPNNGRRIADLCSWPVESKQRGLGSSLKCYSYPV